MALLIADGNDDSAQSVSLALDIASPALRNPLFIETWPQRPTFGAKGDFKFVIKLNLCIKISEKQNTLSASCPGVNGARIGMADFDVGLRNTHARTVTDGG